MPEDFKKHHSRESPWVGQYIRERKKLPRYNGNFICELSVSFIGPDGKTHKYNHFPYRPRAFDLLELAWFFKRAEEVFGIDVELDEEIRELVDDIE